MAEPPRVFNAPFTISRMIPCRSPGCNRWFCNNAGLTQHTRAKHLIAPLRQPVRPNPWPLGDIPDPPQDDFAPMDEDPPIEEVEEGDEWEYHPLLCGMGSLLIFQ